MSRHKNGCGTLFPCPTGKHGTPPSPPSLSPADVTPNPPLIPGQSVKLLRPFNGVLPNTIGILETDQVRWPNGWIDTMTPNQVKEYLEAIPE